MEDGQNKYIVNGRNNYIIAGRSEIEQYMIGFFDRHFRSVLRQMSDQNLLNFIHGRVEPNRSQTQTRGEIINFLRLIK